MAKAKKKVKRSKKRAKRTGKKVKCDLCGKTFGMPAHLGRHNATIHGMKKKAVKKGKKKTAGRPGRPSAIATKFRLKDLSIDDLAALINAAKAEAEGRLKSFQDMLGK